MSAFIASATTNILYLYLARKGCFERKTVVVKQITQNSTYSAYVDERWFRDTVVFTRNDETMYKKNYFISPKIVIESKKE